MFKIDFREKNGLHSMKSKENQIESLGETVISFQIQDKKTTKLSFTQNTSNHAFDTFEKHFKIFLYC